MTIKARMGGSFKAITPSGKVAGVWHKGKKMFVFGAGKWQLVWQDQYIITINSDQTNYKLKDHIKAGTPTDITIVIEAGVTIKSTSRSFSAFYVTGITGKNITIENHGNIYGYFGAGSDVSTGGRGGTAMYITSKCAIINFGKIYGGGGGGGKGGKGADGVKVTTTYTSGREPASGQNYVSPLSIGNGTIWSTPGYNLPASYQKVNVMWKGTTVATLDNLQQTSVKVGAYTYHRGTDTKTGMYGSVVYGIWRQGPPVAVDTNHTVAGTAGGRGGNGQYADHAATQGLSGSAPTSPEAGRGGKGGNGGTWGMVGSKGSRGQSNTTGHQGSNGSNGGLAGHAIDGISHVTYTEHGHLLGTNVH